MFAPIRLYQKCLRISLVREIDKLSLFINRNLTLASNYHTIQIQRSRGNTIFLVKYYFNVITNSFSLIRFCGHFWPFECTLAGFNFGFCCITSPTATAF